MKYISVSQNHRTEVDDNDYNFLNQYKWYYDGMYAFACLPGDKGKSTRMHILLMKPSKGELIDHINRNPLDNRRNNLRTATKSTNSANSKLYQNNTSGFKGVVWHKRANKWQAQVLLKRKNYYLGLFESVKEAAKAYDKKALELFGEFASLNFPAAA